MSGPRISTQWNEFEVLLPYAERHEYTVMEDIQGNAELLLVSCACATECKGQDIVIQRNGEPTGHPGVRHTGRYLRNQPWSL